MISGSFSCFQSKGQSNALSHENYRVSLIDSFALTWGDSGWKGRKVNLIFFVYCVSIVQTAWKQKLIIRSRRKYRKYFQAMINTRVKTFLWNYQVDENSLCTWVRQRNKNEMFEFFASSRKLLLFRCLAVF